MKHADTLIKLIESLHDSDKFHLLIVKGPAGFAKSSSISKALNKLGITFHEIGSYSTPLQLHNALDEHRKDTYVIDDCAGLFNDKNALATLKNATWPSTESVGHAGRVLRWRSSSPLVNNKEFEFKGKIIAAANVIPDTHEVRALLSRAIYLDLIIEPAEIIELLEGAAKSRKHFPDSVTAKTVLDFIVKNERHFDLSRLSIRTLELGYEFAKQCPETWESHFMATAPKLTPLQFVKTLNDDGELSVAQQCREFMRLTGKSKRTFFNYRAELNLSVSEKNEGGESKKPVSKNAITSFQKDKANERVVN